MSGNTIAEEVVRVVKEKLPPNAAEQDVKAFFHHEKNNILTYRRPNFRWANCWIMMRLTMKPLPTGCAGSGSFKKNSCKTPSFIAFSCTAGNAHANHMAFSNTFEPCS